MLKKHQSDNQIGADVENSIQSYFPVFSGLFTLKGVPHAFARLMLMAIILDIVRSMVMANIF